MYSKYMPQVSTSSDVQVSLIGSSLPSRAATQVSPKQGNQQPKVTARLTSQPKNRHVLDLEALM
jgi:hypothetical protein